MTTQTRPSCFRRFSAFKAIILCLLAGSACISFVGCGGDTESSTSPIGEITSSSSDEVIESSDGYAFLLTSSSEQGSSSSITPNESSSSVQSSSSEVAAVSSSSDVVAESSSSDKAESSSSEKSSSSMAESSSSVESSSSEVQSSSSAVESSSSVAESSSSSEDDVSSSSEYYKSNWAYLDKNIVYDTIIDSRDNQVYKVVTIDSQTWMAENLNYYDEKIVGDAICLENKSSNCEKYGRLYNLPLSIEYDSLETTPYKYLYKTDTMNIQGICPNGWRMPTLSDWRIVGKKWSVRTTGISILKNSGYYVENKTYTTDSFFWTVSATSEDRYVYVAHFDVAYKRFLDNRLMKQSTFVSVRCIKNN